MRSSSDSRQHWHDGQLAAAVETDQHQPQEQSCRLHLDGTHDACSSQPDTPVPAWGPVWPRLHGLGLNRQHRLLAWHILREATWCGAYRA